MERILIIKQGALGDAVMATALVRQLVLHHPTAAVVVLTTPPFARLFSTMTGIEVAAFARGGIAETLQTLRFVRSRRFDRLYDLQGSDRSGLIAALSGIPLRVGNHPRFPYHRHPATRYRGQNHIFARMNELLSSAGVAPAEPKPYLPADDAVRDRVDAWLRTQGLAGVPLVLLHAFASPRHPAKRWPHFAALGVELEHRGFVPVWLGGRADAPAGGALSAHAGVSAAGEFDLVELAELGRRAAFAVTNDSGPMHALAASGIPVYAFFGPTNWRRNHALGQAANVITRQPANVEGKHLDDPTYALERIGVGEVLGRLEADGRFTAVRR